MAITSARPFITLTFAQSLDGSIAVHPGQGHAISGPDAMRFTHELRAQHDAILVGIGTVLADDPQLSVRLVPGKNPRPVILDRTLRCPTNARCLDASRHTILATSERASLERERELANAGAVVWRLPASQNQIELRALLARLRDEQIASLMVEGGARVIASFLRAQLVDRIIITIAPMLIGGVRALDELLPSFPRLKNTTMQNLGSDWILSGEIEWTEK